MREIKFRAWDKDKKEMMFDFLLGSGHKNWIPDKNKILMQYSGLKDKNNQEIYEGDILKIENQDHKVIEVICKFEIVRRTMDTGWTVDIPSFCFERKDGLKSFPIVNNYAGKHDLEMLEVIGNIYANNH